MEDLKQVTELLLNQVSHWSSARWGGRGQLLHEALQRIAGPRHPLPRLADTVLPDQLRVVVAEVLAGGDPAEIDRATAELKAVRLSLTSAQ